MDELCPNFKDLENVDQLNYFLNSDGAIVKAVARFFYLANLMHSSVSIKGTATLIISMFYQKELYKP